MDIPKFTTVVYIAQADILFCYLMETLLNTNCISWNHVFPLAFTFKINVNNYFDLDFGGNAHLMISSIAFPPKRNGAWITMTRSVEIFELLVT